jgi:hypothetical protein
MPSLNMAIGEPYAVQGRYPGGRTAMSYREETRAFNEQECTLDNSCNPIPPPPKVPDNEFPVPPAIFFPTPPEEEIPDRPEPPVLGPDVPPEVAEGVDPPLDPLIPVGPEVTENEEFLTEVEDEFAEADGPDEPDEPDAPDEPADPVDPPAPVDPVEPADPLDPVASPAPAEPVDPLAPAGPAEPAAAAPPARRRLAANAPQDTADPLYNNGNYWKTYDTRAPHKVIIRNGVIRRSSHNTIHGGGAPSKIVIEDLKCDEFEVAGIQLNGAKDVIIRNVDVGPSGYSPVVGSHASARFIGFFYAFYW